MSETAAQESHNGFYQTICECGHKLAYHHYTDSSCQRCECDSFDVRLRTPDHTRGEGEDQ